MLSEEGGRYRARTGKFPEILTAIWGLINLKRRAIAAYQQASWPASRMKHLAATRFRPVTTELTLSAPRLNPAAMSTRIQPPTEL